MYKDLVIQQGADFSETITVTNIDGDGINFASASDAKGFMRKSILSVSGVTLGVTTASVGATQGKLIVSLGATYSSAAAHGNYLYDVEITLPTGKIRALEGIITLTPEITKI